MIRDRLLIAAIYALLALFGAYELFLGLVR